jgi:ribose 5-phosphate isomerase B
MRLVLAADHGGVELKDWLLQQLKKRGYDVTDLGTNGTDSVDYPRYALEAARAVAKGDYERGVLVCGTGIGMSIAANKVRGIRCAKINTVDEGRLASGHNHANMIAFGGRTTEEETALKATLAWLETPAGGDRHQRRVQQIMDADGTRG